MEFTKDELVKELVNKAGNLDGLEKFSEKSVEADGEALLRMYVRKPERGSDSPGRILNLKRTGLVEKLEELEQKNYIQMNRTAGLDMVYLNQSVTGEEIVKKYFRP